jgi:hypothetical protein
MGTTGKMFYLRLAELMLIDQTRLWRDSFEDCLIRDNFANYNSKILAYFFEKGER